MSRAGLWRAAGRMLPWAALLVLLATSLYLMAAATQDATRFARYYGWLLAMNALALVLLVAVILQQSIRLYRHLKLGTPGARLIRRFVLVFLGLVATPVLVVYLFSLQLLHRGIDSWFDVRVETSLRNALTLSRLYLEENQRDLLAVTRRAAAALEDVPGPIAAGRLSGWLDETDAAELTLFTAAGDIIATASADVRDFVPDYPEDVVLLIARQRDFYSALEPGDSGGLKLRMLINLGRQAPFEPTRLLQAIYEVPEAVGALADRIAQQYARYQTLKYLREPLKFSFTITLSLVLLLSLLLTMVVAFRAARRLVAPIRNLSEATEDIAAGHYGRQLPVSSDDELGFLVRSFNTMTGELDRSTRRAARSRRQLEDQRAYLEAVLGRLSSGVITLDDQGRLRTVNQAAAEILDVNLAQFRDRPLDAIGAAHRQLEPLAQAIATAHANKRMDWREQVHLLGPAGRQVLMCRGTQLAAPGGGQVVVFDDLTALIQAQRDSAWGEMARRLAHEVKNPLTPIQLSAERIRRRYLHPRQGEDTAVLDRATHTIVQQVEALKKLINAFGDYARAPSLQLAPLSVNALIGEVAELYRHDEKRGRSQFLSSDNRAARTRKAQERTLPPFRVELDLDPKAPLIAADSDRLRQLLHNLIKNAQEAGGARAPREVRIATRAFERAGASFLEISVTDNGPGFPPELRETLFEPYTTTKVKGTGLGLAIVRKIVEEHHGSIRAETPAEGGARVVVWLPARTSGP